VRCCRFVIPRLVPQEMGLRMWRFVLACGDLFVRVVTLVGAVSPAVVWAVINFQGRRLCKPKAQPLAAKITTFICRLGARRAPSTSSGAASSQLLSAAA
jgi:hypothetical protein